MFGTHRCWRYYTATTSTALIGCPKAPAHRKHQLLQAWMLQVITLERMQQRTINYAWLHLPSIVFTQVSKSDPSVLTAPMLPPTGLGRLWGGGASSILIKQASFFCLSSCILNSDSQPGVPTVGDLIYKKEATVPSSIKGGGLGG